MEDLFLEVKTVPTGSFVFVETDQADNIFFSANLARNFTMDLKPGLKPLSGRTIRVAFRNSRANTFYANRITIHGTSIYPLWENALAPKTGAADRITEYELQFFSSPSISPIVFATVNSYAPDTLIRPVTSTTTTTRAPTTTTTTTRTPSTTTTSTTTLPPLTGNNAPFYNLMLDWHAKPAFDANVPGSGVLTVMFTHNTNTQAGYVLRLREEILSNYPAGEFIRRDRNPLLNVRNEIPFSTVNKSWTWQANISANSRLGNVFALSSPNIIFEVLGGPGGSLLSHASFRYAHPATGTPIANNQKDPFSFRFLIQTDDTVKTVNEPMAVVITSADRYFKGNYRVRANTYSNGVIVTPVPQGITGNLANFFTNTIGNFKFYDNTGTRSPRVNNAAGVMTFVIPPLLLTPSFSLYLQLERETTLNNWEVVRTMGKPVIYMGTQYLGKNYNLIFDQESSNQFTDTGHSYFVHTNLLNTIPLTGREVNSHRFTSNINIINVLYNSTTPPFQDFNVNDFASIYKPGQINDFYYNKRVIKEFRTARLLPNTEIGVVVQVYQETAEQQNPFRGRSRTLAENYLLISAANIARPESGYLLNTANLFTTTTTTSTTTLSPLLTTTTTASPTQYVYNLMVDWHNKRIGDVLVWSLTTNDPSSPTIDDSQIPGSFRNRYTISLARNRVTTIQSTWPQINSNIALNNNTRSLFYTHGTVLLTTSDAADLINNIFANYSPVLDSTTSENTKFPLVFNVFNDQRLVAQKYVQILNRGQKLGPNPNEWNYYMQVDSHRKVFGETVGVMIQVNDKYHHPNAYRLSGSPSGLYKTDLLQPFYFYGPNGQPSLETLGPSGVYATAVKTNTTPTASETYLYLERNDNGNWTTVAARRIIFGTTRPQEAYSVESNRINAYEGNLLIIETKISSNPSPALRTFVIETDPLNQITANGLGNIFLSSHPGSNMIHYNGHDMKYAEVRKRTDVLDVCFKLVEFQSINYPAMQPVGRIKTLDANLIVLLGNVNFSLYPESPKLYTTSSTSTTTTRAPFFTPSTTTTSTTLAPPSTTTSTSTTSTSTSTSSTTSTSTSTTTSSTSTTTSTSTTSSTTTSTTTSTSTTSSTTTSTTTGAPTTTTTTTVPAYSYQLQFVNVDQGDPTKVVVAFTFTTDDTYRGIAYTLNSYATSPGLTLPDVNTTSAVNTLQSLTRPLPTCTLLLRLDDYTPGQYVVYISVSLANQQVATTNINITINDTTTSTTTEGPTTTTTSTSTSTSTSTTTKAPTTTTTSTSTSTTTSTSTSTTTSTSTSTTTSTSTSTTTSTTTSSTSTTTTTTAAPVYSYNLTAPNGNNKNEGDTYNLRLTTDDFRTGVWSVASDYPTIIDVSGITITDADITAGAGVFNFQVTASAIPISTLSVSISISRTVGGGSPAVVASIFLIINQL